MGLRPTRRLSSAIVKAASADGRCSTTSLRRPGRQPGQSVCSRRRGLDRRQSQHHADGLDCSSLVLLRGGRSGRVTITAAHAATGAAASQHASRSRRLRDGHPAGNGVRPACAHPRHSASRCDRPLPVPVALAHHATASISSRCIPLIDHASTTRWCAAAELAGRPLASADVFLHRTRCAGSPRFAADPAHLSSTGAGATASLHRSDPRRSRCPPRRAASSQEVSR